MAFRQAIQEDKRVPMYFGKKVSTTLVGEIYTLARSALIDAGRKADFATMKEQIFRSKSARETLHIIQKFVRIVK